VNHAAQGFGKVVDDGTASFAQAHISFFSASQNNLSKKQLFEPFAVGFFGWQALAISRLPFNKLEGIHLGLCQSALAVYDNELDSVLQALSTRPTSVTQFVEATAAEQAAIQKFVVQKYGKKYSSVDLDALLSPNSKAAVAKKDEVASWKYMLGAGLGELAANITKWFAFPNNSKYDAALAEKLRNLNKDLSQAPKDAPQDLLNNLHKLSAFGSKTFFSPDERQLVGAAMKEVLQAAMSLLNPPPTATANPPMSKTRTAADLARDNEIAESYYQYGLQKSAAGLFDPAMYDFNKAIEINPNLAKYFFGRGQNLFKKNDWDAAIADFTRAINLGGLSDEDAEYLNQRALAYYQKGNHNAALTDLTVAVSLNAKNVYGYYLRGFIHRLRGNLAQAKADQQAALNINPQYQPAKDELKKLEQ
jgi:tetratricopeptide (TPR) repeat protein